MQKQRNITTQENYHHPRKNTKNHKIHVVSSMMALTMSPELVLRALTAFDLDTPACVITRSMSLGSTPDSSTSSSTSSSSSWAPDNVRPSGLGPARPTSGALNCWAACVWSWELRSSSLASPNMIYVSEFGLLNTSGFEMKKSICTPIKKNY
ncbi:mitochondrial division protein 1 [Striga asiatica]|uniref:Mitochondrial division protein 1 n=1 Tax=Striga asiatica TaxID=4170 RepID=A0A5A7PL07_STRAF|nr:mitochondrial division protein 1 [Striga asiatica]